MKGTVVSLSAVTIYVTGLIIGSLFGVFIGVITLVAIIFAIKLFKYNRQTSEEPADLEHSPA